MSSNATSKDGGATVTSSTCSDERHPASCILDGDEKTFWYTTGMFPQEVVISFPKEISPQSIAVVTRHVKQFTLFTCEKSDAKSWVEALKSGEVDRNHDALQRTEKQLNVKNPIRFVKLRIDSGHEEFVGVYDVRIEAKPEAAKPAEPAKAEDAPAEDE